MPSPSHVYTHTLQSPLLCDIDGQRAILQGFEVRHVAAWSPDGFELPGISVRFLVDPASMIDKEQCTVVLSEHDAAMLVGAIAGAKVQPLGPQVEAANG